MGDVIPIDKIPLFLMLRYADSGANKVLMFRYSNAFISAHKPVDCVLEITDNGLLVYGAAAPIAGIYAIK